MIRMVLWRKDRREYLADLLIAQTFRRPDLFLFRPWRLLPHDWWEQDRLNVPSSWLKTGSPK